VSGSLCAADDRGRRTWHDWLVSVESRLFDHFGLGEEDRAAWAASGLPTEAFEDWLTDRVARRPTGARARAVYGARDIHDFARRAILDALALRAGDRLLDVGCGGGLLLADAIELGATTTGLDHSDEMVALAGERAPDAQVLAGRAEELPFPDAAFSAVAMCVVFFFLTDPVVVLRECRRVLGPGGRLAVYMAGPEMRATPACPEPLAAHGRFYEDAELEALARQAGFADTTVIHEDGGQLLAARL
jgi:SAM-dependent methyltransferase